MSNYAPTYFSRKVVAELRGVLAMYDLKQEEIASLCGVSQSQFSKIIRGVRPMTLDQFAAICDYVNHDYEDLLLGAVGQINEYGFSASPVKMAGLDPTLVPVDQDKRDPWALEAAERMGLNVGGSTENANPEEEIEIPEDVQSAWGLAAHPATEGPQNHTP